MREVEAFCCSTKLGFQFLAAVPGAVAAAAVPSVLGFREGFFPDTRVIS